jgi:hypothetical protein
MKRLVIFGMSALVAVALVPLALADQVYHTQKIALTAVGGAPLDSGRVQNIHPNGPNNYAHEIYFLYGALPTTTFYVFLLVYVDDTACSGPAGVHLNTTTLVTNRHGHGTADAFLTPEMAAGLRPSAGGTREHGVRWELSTDPAGANVVYETTCSVAVLD